MKDYKKTMWARVIGPSRHDAHLNETVMGRIFEVRMMNYHAGVASLWNSDRSDSVMFDLSSIQQVFPECVKEGYAIGVGDIILIQGFKKEVYDAYLYCEEWRILTRIVGTENSSHSYGMSEDFTVIPLHPQKPVEKEAKAIEKVDLGKIRGEPEYGYYDKDEIIEKALNQVINAVNSLLSAKAKGNE